MRGNVDKERGSGTKPFEEGIMGQRPEVRRPFSWEFVVGRLWMKRGDGEGG